MGTLDNDKNKRRRVVFKFGGKALSDGGQTRQLAEKLFLELKTGKQAAIVVSAIGNTTDMLIEYCGKACGQKISKRDLDEILAMGERTSARLFTTILKAQGINAKFLDPSDNDWPIITDDHFGDANPLEEECLPRIRSKLEKLFNENVVPVIPGFIGKTLHGEITTLGRGGSDTTAFLVAKAIGASEVILVTDVAGIMSADPKIVPDAKVIHEINVEKLVNLCDLDAKFIHRKALKFLDGSFKVKITSYRNRRLGERGTVIRGTIHNSNVSAENALLACITVVAKKSLDLWKIVPKIFKIIKKNNISVLLFSVDTNSLTLYVRDMDSEKAAKILHSKLILGEEESSLLALTMKREIMWTKIPWTETEKIYKEMEIMKKHQRKVFGILTTTSNIHFFTTN